MPGKLGLQSGVRFLIRWKDTLPAAIKDLANKGKCIQLWILGIWGYFIWNFTAVWIGLDQSSPKVIQLIKSSLFWGSTVKEDYSRSDTITGTCSSHSDFLFLTSAIVNRSHHWNMHHMCLCLYMCLYVCVCVPNIWLWLSKENVFMILQKLL